MPTIPSGATGDATMGRVRSVLIVSDLEGRVHPVRADADGDTVLTSHRVAIDDTADRRYQGLLDLIDGGLSLDDLVVILREPLYRTQVEFLPQTARRHALKALTTLARPADHEFPVIERLAATTIAGAPAEAWMVSAVRSHAVDDLIAALESRRVRIRKIVIDQELAAASSAFLDATRREDRNSVVVSVTEHHLDFTCLTSGRIALTRRMAISDGLDIGKRVASELQRSAVFFHRKFPAAQLDQALVVIHTACDAESVVAEIRAANRIAAVDLVTPRAIGLSEQAAADSADLASLRWVGSLRDSGLARLAGVVTPAAREARSRRRFAPLMTLAVVVFSAISFLYLSAIDANLEEHRELAGSRSRAERAARSALAAWNEARGRQEELVGRARALDRLLDSEFDVVGALESISALVPEDVSVESIEFSLGTGRGTVGGAADAWIGRVVFRTGRDYFEAADAIERTRRSLATADFLRGAEAGVEILPDSLPWRNPNEEVVEGCRFSLDFRTEGS